MKNAPFLILGALLLMSFTRSKKIVPGEQPPRPKSERARTAAKGGAAPMPGSMDAPPPTGAGGSVVGVPLPDGSIVYQVVPL